MFYDIKNHKREKINRFSDRRQRFYNFLKENPVGVLSTVTPNGDPHGVVIYFCVDKNLSASFITRSETKKCDNLEYNNHVTLTVFEPKTQATTQIIGEAVEITDSRKINGIAGTIFGISSRTSEADFPPVAKLEAGKFVGYEIIPKQVRMAVYARPDPGEYGDLFESIESFELESDSERNT